MDIDTKINQTQVCTWDYGGGIYETDCGRHFHFENHQKLRNADRIKYCPVCGKTIIKEDEEKGVINEH